MAVTQVSIINRALDKLGCSAITAITDNTKSAKVMSRAWEPVLNDLLEKHNWSFARKRASLVLASGTPIFDFEYQFTLPTDYCRLVKTNPENIEYSIENGVFLTNAAEVDLLYIYKLTDVTKFTSSFVELMSHALAASTCYNLVQSETKNESIRNEYLKYMRWAMSDDSKIGATPTQPSYDYWMQNRGFGNSVYSDAYVDPTTDYGSV